MLCFKIFKKVQRKEDLCTSAWASKPAFVEKFIQVVTNHIGHRCACKTLHSARTKIQFQYSREHKKHRRADHLWGDQAHPWVSGFDNSRPAHPGSVLAGSKFYHPDVQLCTCVPCAFTCIHDVFMIYPWWIHVHLCQWLESRTTTSTWGEIMRDVLEIAWDCLRLLENVGLRKWGGNAVGKLRGSLSISILYNDVMYSRRSLWSLGISSGKSLRIVFALTSILEAFAFAVQILTLLNMYTGVHVHAVLRFKQIQTLNL